jgi:hypothetical protein
MAAWQAHFDIVLPEGRLPDGYRDAFAAVLPAGSSWAPALQIWGATPNDCIEVFAEDGEVEARARFDLRSPNLETYRRFVLALQSLGCELRDEGGSSVDLSEQSFKGALTRSQAFRFVSDPHGFFDELAKRRST